MATETIEMMIRMRDELSKPLTAQQKALKGVNEQIRKMKDESRKASGIQKEHAKLLKTQRDNTLNLIPGVKHLRSNMAELGTGMGLAVGASALVIAAVATGAVGVCRPGVGLIYTTAKVLGLVSPGTSWAERTRTMFATISPSDDERKTQLTN